jgi:hypothetical protein
VGCRKTVPKGRGVRGHGTAEVAQNGYGWAWARCGGDVEAERYGRSSGRGCGYGKRCGSDVVAAQYMGVSTQRRVRVRTDGALPV